jgi:hypothetical protein
MCLLANNPVRSNLVNCRWQAWSKLGEGRELTQITENIGRHGLRVTTGLVLVWIPFLLVWSEFVESAGQTPCPQHPVQESLVIYRETIVMESHETAANNHGKTLADTNLQDGLATQLKFQRRWRILSMSAYVVTTIGTLVCSSGATYFAAGGKSPNVAAILAAIATILVGTEKSLLFREKWKFHLLMYTKLNVLRSKLQLGRLTPEQASDEYAAIMTLYASELPMAAREQS